MTLLAHQSVIRERSVCLSTTFSQPFSDRCHWLPELHHLHPVQMVIPANLAPADTQLSKAKTGPLGSYTKSRNVMESFCLFIKSDLGSHFKDLQGFNTPTRTGIVFLIVLAIGKPLFSSANTPSPQHAFFRNFQVSQLSFKTCDVVLSYPSPCLFVIVSDII